MSIRALANVVIGRFEPMHLQAWNSVFNMALTVPMNRKRAMRAARYFHSGVSAAYAAREISKAMFAVTGK